MTHRKIKVVKRDAAAPEAPVEEKQPEDTERGMSNTVKDWISERRLNSQRETARDKRKFARLSKLNNPSRKPA
jgi:hypothetical protein